MEFEIYNEIVQNTNWNKELLHSRMKFHCLCSGAGASENMEQMSEDQINM